MGVGLAGGRVGVGFGVGVAVGVAVGVGLGVVTILAEAGVDFVTNAWVVAGGVVPVLAVDWLAFGAAMAAEQVQRKKTATIAPQPMPNFVRLRRVRYQFHIRRRRDAGGGGGTIG